MRRDMQQPTAEAYQTIYKQHLMPGAPTPVNLPGQMMSDAVDIASQLVIDSSSASSLRSARLILLRIQAEIVNLLNRDTLSRFKQTPAFKQYLAKGQPHNKHIYNAQAQAQAQNSRSSGRARERDGDARRHHLTVCCCVQSL